MISLFRLRRNLIRATASRARRLPWLRLGVLMVYTIMNIGLPSGAGPKIVNRTTVSCQCSAETRAAGKCCCRQRPTGKSGCCSTRVVANTKSCCAKKSESRPATAEATNELSFAWTSDCPCGEQDTPMVLLCAQPRILGDAAVVVELSCQRLIETWSCAPCGHRARPSVPPPECVVVS